MQKALMLGAGTCPPMRRIQGPDSAPEEETEWTTLDISPAAKPDYVFDLEVINGSTYNLPGGRYDEIHAYDVLEHFGRQGDYRGFFYTFNAFHRALVPGGLLFATVPEHDSIWAWGDPGHTRVILPQTIAYLEKEHYQQLGRTRCTDYRAYIDPQWWKIEEIVHKEGSLEFAMRAV